MLFSLPRSLLAGTVVISTSLAVTTVDASARDQAEFRAENRLQTPQVRVDLAQGTTTLSPAQKAEEEAKRRAKALEDKKREKPASPPPPKVTAPPPPPKTVTPPPPATPPKVVAPPPPATPPKVVTPPPPATPPKVVTPPPSTRTDTRPAAKQGVTTTPTDTKPSVTTLPGTTTPPVDTTLRRGANPAKADPSPIAAPTLEQIKQNRRQTVDRDNRTIIREQDKRVIVKTGKTVVIRSDENRRLDRFASDNVTRTRGRNGSEITVIQRDGDRRIYSETDRDGRLVRRWRRGGDGREVTIIDNRRRDSFGRAIAIGLGVGIGALIVRSALDVPPPRVIIPREKYVVEYEGASDDDLYEAFSAPPIERIRRPYSLDEVRSTHALREHMRRVDLNDINFEFGAWEIEEPEQRKLDRVARAMIRVLDANPDEVFLIEGHADRVGDEVDNLTLSDRRAEAVAEILTQEFDIPPENLTTQGYGEQYPKVDTDGASRLNRRVAVRRITPLLSMDGPEGDRDGRDRDRDDRDRDRDRR